MHTVLANQIADILRFNDNWQEQAFNYAFIKILRGHSQIEI